MIKNKKGFLARTWLIAFIVGVAVVGLQYLMVQGLATEYGNIDVIDESFQSVYGKYSDLTIIANNTLIAAREKGGLSVVGTFTTMFSATFKVINLIFSTLLLPGTMLYKLALYVNAPPAVAAILFTLPLAVIIIMIVLVIISSVSRGKL